ncbi:unnamed protein product [Durusdinium trenchii]|uniref:Uncharacterized protein n=1 Tax=Durusdinium trenchii TaxID=1381693 RepID=A0ABP0MUW2_9DINO
MPAPPYGFGHQHVIFTPHGSFAYNQVLATMHCICALTFCLIWRRGDAPILLSELQIYLMTGWSFWLLGAAYSLVVLRGLSMAVQIVVASFQGASCACIEFAFTYLLQCRLSLLERGFGSPMGSQVAWRIRLFTMVCQLSLVVIGAQGEAIGSQKARKVKDNQAIDWAYAAFHLTAAIGVTSILLVSVRAFWSVTNAMREIPVPKQSFAKMEKEWSLNVFKRMTLAVVVSASVSITAHLFCVHAILLVHGGFRAILGTAYHFADIVAEVMGLIFIVGILKPEMPDIKPEIRSMRGASMLFSETSSIRGRAKLRRALSKNAQNAKVQELAHCSIDLENLLDFYDKLGGETMKHFNPFLSTTADVVRQAVIPLSRMEGMEGRGFAYTDVLAAKGKLSQQMPDCMVTHTWSGLFLHLVAAIVSDALGLDEYHRIASKMSSGKLMRVKQKLAAKGVLHNRYWICCFCVNQHASICNGVGEAPSDPAALARWERNRRDTVTGQLLSLCDCKEPKVLNDQPDKCELNKFHSMMLWLQQQKPNFRQLVAADGDFNVFERAWCVAELVAAHDADIPQRICLYSNSPFDFDEEDLSAYAKLASISVANSVATRQEDKEMVLQQIFSVKDFDRELQHLIFGNRLVKQKSIGYDSLALAARTSRRLQAVWDQVRGGDVKLAAGLL